MDPEQDTQRKAQENLKCLGTISSNCCIVDLLRGSIKYHSQTHALLYKGPETIKVFTWPGVQAGHFAQPLAVVLKQLIVGTSVIVGATLVASPTPIPTLKLILIIFTPKDQSSEVLRIFKNSHLQIQNVEGYYCCMQHLYTAAKHLSPTTSSEFHLTVGITRIKYHVCILGIIGLRVAQTSHQVCCVPWGRAQKVDRTRNLVKQCCPCHIRHLSKWINLDVMSCLKQHGFTRYWMKPSDGPIGKGGTKTIELLQQLLTTVSIRRLKTEVLKMLPKVEEQVGVRLQEPWQEDYLQQYHNFANTFRVNRWSETWDVMEFFQQLKMLQLYCDHLGLLYCSKWDLPKNKTMWRQNNKWGGFFTVDSLPGYLRGFCFSVGVALKMECMNFEQLNGACSIQQRERSFENFRKDARIQILLASIGAGGVGIDLTYAQKVYLMEPCWNPRIESQASNRAYCLGQNCTTHITCYFVEDRIEMVGRQLMVKSNIYTFKFVDTKKEAGSSSVSIFLFTDIQKTWHQ
ncbi:uncharacterized protein VP01_49g9 [Puccinia sorghi]|uniref:Helicase C-terminal domain-containing protein n=1 Tax=Puccinia sorghi TaxID=27349 RepID=A0A0L6ULR8_9BASI|nr:uncharacterized protein VP01_49g9 [Puccinia sorghi]